VIGIYYKLLANDRCLGFEADLLSVIQHRSIRHPRGLLYTSPVGDFHNRRITGLLLHKAVYYSVSLADSDVSVSDSFLLPRGSFLYLTGSFLEC
jgi:hypothetical protein